MENLNYMFDMVKSDVEELDVLQKRINIWKSNDVESIKIEIEQFEEELHNYVKNSWKLDYYYIYKMLDIAIDGVEQELIGCDCPICNKHFETSTFQLNSLEDVKRKTIKEEKTIKDKVGWYEIEIIRRNNILKWKHKSIKELIGEKRKIKKRIVFHLKDHFKQLYGGGDKN